MKTTLSLMFAALLATAALAQDRGNTLPPPAPGDEGGVPDARNGSVRNYAGQAPMKQAPMAQAPMTQGPMQAPYKGAGMYGGQMYTGGYGGYGYGGYDCVGCQPYSQPVVYGGCDGGHRHRCHRHRHRHRCRRGC